MTMKEANMTEVVQPLDGREEEQKDARFLFPFSKTTKMLSEPPIERKQGNVVCASALKRPRRSLLFESL